MKNLKALALFVVLLLGLLMPEILLAQGKNPPPGQPNQAAAAGLGIGILVCIGLSAVIGLALTIWMILFVVKDTKRRGMDATLWIILIIFVGWIAFVIYMCVRQPLLSEQRRKRSQDEDEYEDDDRPRRRSSGGRRRDDDDYDDDDRRGGRGGRGGKDEDPFKF